MIKTRTYILLALLSATAHVAAQPKAHYDRLVAEMGTLLWQQPGVATFTVENQGNEPLVITDVRPDCGCTVAVWTREPIRHGRKGTITISYDASAMGHFDKQIGVFTNAAQRPVYLKVSGQVVRQAAYDESNFPYKVGDLRLSTDNIEFDDVNKGDNRQQVISVLNTGTANYSPQLMHLPRYLKAVADPAVVRPGRMGHIRVSLDSRQLQNMGLTQTEVYLSRREGDIVSDDNALQVSVVLLPPLQYSNTIAPQNAPHIKLEPERIDLGQLDGMKKLKGELTLTNTGQSPLLIRSLQVFSPVLSVDVARKLLPGRSAKLKLTVNPRYMRKRQNRLSVLMITNDPARQKVVVDVKLRDSVADDKK